MSDKIYLTTYLDQRNAEQWPQIGASLFEQVEQSFDRMPVQIERVLLWNCPPRKLTEEQRQALKEWVLEHTPLCAYSPLGYTLWRSLHQLGQRLPPRSAVVFFESGGNGRVNSPDWAADLLGVSAEYAGCVHWSDYRLLGIDRNSLHNFLWQAVDPGLFKVTSDLLKKVEPHPGLTEWFGETWFSYQVQRMGLSLMDVQSIRCVRRGRLKNPEKFSFVSDEQTPAVPA